MATLLTQKERMAAIAAHRAELDNKIRNKERRISRLYNELSVSSKAPIGSVSSLISNAGTIATVIDGVLLGYRVMAQFRRLFR